MDSESPSDNIGMTYGGLDEALHELGFVSSACTNEFGFPYVDYVNADYEAEIIIPSRPPAEPLYGGHLVVARVTLEGKGVTDAKSLYQLIRDHSQSGAQAA